MENNSSELSKGGKVKGWFIPFLVVLVFLACLSYVITYDLIKPIAWSSLLAFLVYPLYRYVNEDVFHSRHANIVAAIVTVLLIFVIVVPAVMAGFVTAREGIKLYIDIAEYMRTINWDNINLLSLVFPEFMIDYFGPLLEKFTISPDFLQQTGRWLASTIGSVSRDFLGNAISIVLQLVVIAVATFFLLRDGHYILEFVKDITPLSDNEKDAFYARARRILQSVVYGIVLTAIIQGILGGLGWYYVGLPAPLLFGALMAFLAVFPIIGTPLVWIPGSVYLFYSGDWKGALILFIWGAVIVSLVDNLIRPLIVSEGSKIHILIIFIGVVGGLTAWGFIGLFLGPLVVSLFMFMLDNYRKEWKNNYIEAIHNNSNHDTEERDK